MTREETKAAIKVMQAYVDGKEIEHNYQKSWCQTDYPTWAWGDNPKSYRIKPEPHICPYRDMEDFMKAMREHNGWLLVKNTSYATNPVYFDNSGVGIMDKAGYVIYSYKELLECFTWLDSAPCGVVVE